MSGYLWFSYLGMAVYLAWRWRLTRELSRHYDPHGFIFVPLVVFAPITLPCALAANLLDRLEQGHW